MREGGLMRAKVLIIADDLTGALDSAVGFAAPGRRVMVARSPEDVAETWATRPDVLAVNTSSREISAKAAAARVTHALEALSPDDFDVVMKKVDSRLKGNPAAETAALARWAGRARQVACPAIPEMDRRVEGGALVGAGVADPIPVASRFDDPVEVPEIGSDAELDRLITDAPDSPLWIGARGLSFALARQLGVTAPPDTGLAAPVMIANGSRDPVTLTQIAALPENLTRIEAPDGTTSDAVPTPGQPLALTITDGGGALPGAEAARRFAETIARTARAARPAALVICGGESAQAALDRLSVTSLQIIAELRPGLPLCRIDTAWGPVDIVTKSGGFGAPGLLAEIVTTAGTR
ncbi:hypothetical protein CVM50_11010 [Pseudooceanicola marinus]|nr:hypothetical protein CVM50_11010 [Pseudooceanicola marinus]